MKISIVLLNYGYHDFLFECLRSVNQMQKRTHCELILVDNGSSEDDWLRTQQRLADPLCHVDKCIRLTSNLGFAAGMNAGAEIAQGEWVVMLNNDTLLGNRFVEQILAAPEKVKGSEIGFLALPIYDWRYTGTESVRTTRWQADVVGLTWYISCLPVRHSQIKPRFVLGPPGPVVIISSRLIRALKENYGCVYDPHFFMYGEDVDLFLRAKRLGFDTFYINGSAGRGEVVWHIGSGTSAGEAATVRTVGKDPAIVRRILDGMYDNLVSHAAWLELVPLILAHYVFRMIFYLTYAIRKSPRDLWLLLRTRREPRPLPSARKHGRRFGFWLMTYIAVSRRLLPWARRSGNGVDDQSKDYASPDAFYSGVTKLDASRGPKS